MVLHYYRFLEIASVFFLKWIKIPSENVIYKVIFIFFFVNFMKSVRRTLMQKFS